MDAHPWLQQSTAGSVNSDCELKTWQGDNKHASAGQVWGGVVQLQEARTNAGEHTKKKPKERTRKKLTSIDNIANGQGAEPGTAGTS